MRGNPLTRLGVIFVGDELKSPALKLFILAMNHVQECFEYEFLPEDIEDELISELNKSTNLDRESTRSLATNFPNRVNSTLSKFINDYEIVDKGLPDYFIVASMAKFTDNYFSMRQPGVSVIALGNWKKSMAPPSIFEFIQTLIIREAVASVCPALRGSMHLGSKGCVCDFSPSLGDARLKVLNAFVCSYCRGAMEATGHKTLADEVEQVLARSWIGDLETPTSLASTLAKFGINLFVTKGLKPTWSESVLNSIREDGVKELIKWLFLVLGGAVLAYWGLKS
jgi:hypothetical protein